MSERQITIAIDAMGGENSPFKVLKGTEIFLANNYPINIIFFGNEPVSSESFSHPFSSILARPSNNACK